MSKARTAKPLKTKRHPVKLAEVAFNELSLNAGTWTQADTARLWALHRRSVRPLHSPRQVGLLVG